MQEEVEHFFNEKNRGNSPLLLAFSGGSDSLALAHLMHRLNIHFHLAHFDHGWRESSREQALELALLAEKLELPFFTERSLDPKPSELEGRVQRYAFLKKQFHLGEYQAIVFAHHLQDQAETVLKRVLEGAHLHNLQAMRPVSLYEGIPIWRPLLGVAKEEIESYLKAGGLEPIRDPCNQELRYLRVRMRKEIFPQLEQSFGKKIGSPLAKIGDSAAKLYSYLEENTKKIVWKEDEKGIFCDLMGAHPIEIDFVLSRAPFPTPSVHSLKKIYWAISTNQKRVEISNGLIVERGRVIWAKSVESLVN